MLQGLFRPVLRPIMMGVMAVTGSRRSWSPTTLFSAGEAGGLWDFSTLANLYQDSTGTTPCTAVGQPIGLVLDTSGNGNHASQATPTKRPILGRMPAGGARNLLTYTEDFSKSVWAAENGCIRTSSTLSFSSAPISRAYQLVGFSGSITISLYVDPGDVGKQVYLAIWADGYDGISNGRSPLKTIPANGFVSHTWENTTGGFVVGVVGDGVAITLNNPKLQLEAGSTATAYQKVGAVYDVTESGVASVYTAYFDGVDDCLVSPSIDFSGTDAMSVFSGFRKTSDAARGMVAELSATTASNNGSFALTAPNAASATIVYESKGTSLTDTSATIAAPADSVISAVSDISADSNVLRRNGVQTDSDTGDQGTGNFGNYPIYVGQRAAASLPYKGFLSLLCVRGAASTADEISDMEAYMVPKTPGVTPP